jgi:hypothetical protein
MIKYVIPTSYTQFDKVRGSAIQGARSPWFFAG